jgi:hypothetical protein
MRSLSSSVSRLSESTGNAIEESVHDDELIGEIVHGVDHLGTFDGDITYCSESGEIQPGDGAWRVSAGKHILLADLCQENAHGAAKVLSDAGFEVTTATVDVFSRRDVHVLVEKATTIGTITGVINAAGVSPTQASPATFLKVDLYGTWSIDKINVCN